MSFSNGNRLQRMALSILCLCILVFSGHKAEAQDASVSFSEAERLWLSEHPTLKLGVGIAFPPFMWVDKKDGRTMFKGIVSDYVGLLEKKLNTDMQLALDITFDQALARGRNGQIDLFPCLSKTPERAQFLLFTKPYLSYPLVIIIREGAPIVGAVVDLNGKRLAVVKHLSVYSKLQNDYPTLDIKYLFTRTTEENLEAVSLGRADACITNLAVATYYIQKKGLTNLRIAASVNWEGIQLCMGIRKDLPILKGIIEKALASISQEEKDRISQRWIRAKYEPGVNVKLVWRWSLGIGLGILLLFFLILGWNRRLKKEILHREKVEKALRESEERYRILVENAGEAIFVAQGGMLKFVNRKAEELSGRPRTELLSTTFDKFIHPDDRSFLLERQVRRRQGTPVPSNYSFRLMDKSGQVKWVEANAVLIDWEGRIATLNFLRDITDRKRADEALRESESNLQSVFDAVPVGVCFMKDRVYKRANKNLCDNFGYPEESLIGKTPDFLYESKEEYERVGKKLYGQLLEDGIAPTYGKLKRSDGEFRDVELIAKPLNTQDLEAGTVVVIHDITERKRAENEKRRLEDQLQQAQKMEAIGTLAGGIAHDFNNLLMAIQGRTSIMLMDKDSSYTDFAHLKGIENDVANAADLTKQLLGFARRGKYEVRPTDLNELIRKESLMFGRTKKEIVIREKYEKDIWPVEIDRGQIQQVLLNLYVNAWQAMPGGGNLYVETENVTLDENYVKPFSTNPGRYVKMSITDTGIGMDKAIQGKIFDPFFTTKELERGTGLGLASAYGIIKNHGGFINVYSEKGHGSTFRIYLPASEKEIIEEKKSTGDTLRGVETVLLVDDEGMIIEISENLLSSLGYNVLTEMNLHWFICRP
jgi:two-component system cell cycle sensor histidine kinase/response regulator CckA